MKKRDKVGRNFLIYTVLYYVSCVALTSYLTPAAIRNYEIYHSEQRYNVEQQRWGYYIRTDKSAQVWKEVSKKDYDQLQKTDHLIPYLFGFWLFTVALLHYFDRTKMQKW